MLTRALRFSVRHHGEERPVPSYTVPELAPPTFEVCMPPSVRNLLRYSDQRYATAHAPVRHISGNPNESNERRR